MSQPARAPGPTAGSGYCLFAPGRAVVRRCLHVDGRIATVQSARVVQDTPEGLLLWARQGVLIWSLTGAAHSVWWWFDEQGFTGGYVNLETPTHRWAGGIDVLDHALDVVVDADRRWQWKDEDEFSELTGTPGFWDVTEADQIRAEGRRVVSLIDAAARPFDGTWCDFVPEPSWGPSALPHWWDEPTSLAQRNVWAEDFYH